MLTTILNLNKRVLVVDVPAGELTSIGNYNEVYYAIKIDGQEHCKKIADGKKWKFLCKGEELMEEVAKLLVDSRNINYQDIYFDYKEDCWFDESMTAIDSFISVIETNGFHWFKNPIVKPIGEDYYYEEKHSFDEAELLWDGGSYNEDLEKWQEAESKTFKNPLIFEIIK